MNILRRFLALGLAIILMLGAGGCMKKNSTQKIQEEMLDYITNKYGEEFTVLSMDAQV